MHYHFCLCSTDVFFQQFLFVELLLTGYNVCILHNVFLYLVVLVVKNLTAKAGDIRNVGFIPGSGRFPGREHGNPLQCSCPENPMDRGARWAMVHRVTKSWVMPELRVAVVLAMCYHFCLYFIDIFLHWFLCVELLLTWYSTCILHNVLSVFGGRKGL